MDEKGVVIEREFDAPVEKLWQAWTDPEMIKQWWGPEHFYAPSIKNDLRVGGMYIFAMHGPKDSQFDKDMYSAGIYKEIVPPSGSNPGKLVVTDYFSDEEGNMVSPQEAGLEDPNFPKELTVTVLFEKVGVGKSKLSIVYPKPETEEQVQAMLKSGMKDGWNSSLDKLGNVLKGV
ncbi:MAG: SRPBCC family protein [Candidatus Levyibacteriota bacterium]